MIGDPPLLLGAVKETIRLASSGEIDVIVGAPGVSAGEADTLLDAVPEPLELTARTLTG